MQFKRRMKPQATIDLIPMIDVVFQLVVFFMVSSTFILTPGISMNLPESTSAEPVFVSKLIVTIVDKDEIYLNEDRTSMSGLKTILSKFSAEEKEAFGSIIIEGNKNVSYELMINVLDILRINGFRGVNLKMKESK